MLVVVGKVYIVSHKCIRIACHHVAHYRNANVIPPFTIKSLEAGLGRSKVGALEQKMRYKAQHKTGCNFKTLLFLVDTMALILRAPDLVRQYVFKRSNLLFISISVFTNLLNNPIFVTVLGRQARYVPLSKTQAASLKK